jgi:ribosome-binding factor A
MTSHRQQHVSKLLQEELNLLLSGELDDPRLIDAMINVTRVSVSQDLRSARVYFEHALPAEETRRVLAALGHAEGFLRESLAASMNLRYVPELTFHADETDVRARRVDEILDEIHHRPSEGEHAVNDSAF